MTVAEALAKVENLLNLKNYSAAQSVLDLLKSKIQNESDIAEFCYLQSWCLYQKIEAEIFIEGQLNTKIDLKAVLKSLDYAKEFCQQALPKIDKKHEKYLYKNTCEMQDIILKLQATLCWDFSLFDPNQAYTQTEYKNYKDNALMAQEYYRELLSFVYLSNWLGENTEKQAHLLRKHLDGCENQILGIEVFIQQSEKSEESPKKKKKIEHLVNEQVTSVLQPVTPLVLSLSQRGQPKNTRSNINSLEERYISIETEFKKFQDNIPRSNSRLWDYMLKLDNLFDQSMTLRKDIKKIQLNELNNKIYLTQVYIREWQAITCWNSTINENQSYTNVHQCRETKNILYWARKHYEQYYTLVLHEDCPLSKEEKKIFEIKKIEDIEECSKKIDEMTKLIELFENKGIEKLKTLCSVASVESVALLEADFATFFKSEEKTSSKQNATMQFQI